jgi:hypothetical protein
MKAAIYLTIAVVIIAVLFITGIFTIEESNPCEQNFGGTGKTHGIDTYLTGEFRESDGDVYLRCVDGQEVD